MLTDALAKLRAGLAGAESAIAAAVLGVLVPGVGVDPWLMSMIIGHLLATQPSEDPAADRERTLDDWKPAVKAQLAAWKASPTPDIPALPTPESGTLVPLPPPGMPEPLREAWIQARTRAGDYARGLGSVIRQWPNEVDREVWEGEDLTAEVDADTRLTKRRAVQAATAEAIEKRWTPERLASELGHKTREWSRNWDRIARTELQQAHNEGVAITALRDDGEGARVARIPESGACDHCLRLFTEDGKPIIFRVVDLLENGTNVGKKAADWLPTIGPVHPQCRCGCQIVPPGMTLADNGWLVPE